MIVKTKLLGYGDSVAETYTTPSGDALTPMVDVPPTYQGGSHRIYRRVNGSATRITQDTLLTMARHVRLALNDRRVPFQLVAKFLADSSVTTLEDFLRKVFTYTQRKIKFEEDHIKAKRLGYPANTEVLVNPILYWEGKETTGDCDDFSMFVATIVLAQQIWPVDVSFVVVRTDKSSEWEHVYVAVRDVTNGTRYPMDCSHGKVFLWEAGKEFNIVERGEVKL